MLNKMHFGAHILPNKFPHVRTRLAMPQRLGITRVYNKENRWWGWGIYPRSIYGEP